MLSMVQYPAATSHFQSLEKTMKGYARVFVSTSCCKHWPWKAPDQTL
jgi:hypothetical protein